MKHQILLILCFLFIGVQAFSQTSVSGKVVDTSGSPMPGVSVAVKGTALGTITATDGTFSLTRVPAKSSLTFSFIGYQSQQISVGNKKSFNVVMQEDTKVLDEVVVVSYGTQKKKDLTGAISQVDSRILSVQSNSTVSRSLEGQAPGVQISSVDGQPGLDTGIRIRGIGSTSTSSSALIVIDGVPQIQDGANNPLSSINPNDIESLTVLKDASSTAIYGARGANGVILVTTKVGKTGKAKISFSAKVGANSISPYSNLNQVTNSKDFYEFAWKSIYNSYRYGVTNGKPSGFATNVNTPLHTDAEAGVFASQHLFNYIGSETSFTTNQLGNYMAYDVPGAVYTPDGTTNTHSSTMSGAYLVNPDGKLNPDARLLYNESFRDQLISTRTRQEYNVSASGGTDKLNYFSSLGYLNDPSYISNTGFERITGRFTMNAEITSWLKVGTNVGFTHSAMDQMSYRYGRNPGSAGGNIFRFIYGTAPIVPVYAYNQDGSYRYDSVTGTNHNFRADGTYSPLGRTGAIYQSADIIYTQDHDVYNNNQNIWNSRTYAEFSFLKYFKFRTTMSYDQNNTVKTIYQNSLTGLGSGTGGMFKAHYDYKTLNLQETLTFDRDIQKHHVDAMLTHEYNDTYYTQMQWGAGYELIPGLVNAANFVGRYVNAGTMGTPAYAEWKERLESYLGRANYVYDDKYYASLSFRRDGSSIFRHDRWGTFWSVGAGWRFTQEKFMESTKNWLDNAKLRLNYGVIGNLSPFSGNHYTGYTSWGYGAGKYVQTTNGTGVPTGTDYTLSMGGFVNDGITWEKTKTLDMGIDLSFLKSRINLSFDFYNRLTDNAMFAQPVSLLATGQGTLQGNVASLRNRGFEVELSADVIRTKDLSWNVTLNGTHFRTKLVDMPKGIITDTSTLPKGTYEANNEGWSLAGTGTVSAGAFYLRGVGRGWYNLWIYKYAGVDQNSGLPLYWHRVTDTEAQAGTYTDTNGNILAEGANTKVLDYNKASKYEVGSAVPWWVGGLTTTLRYKDFDFTAVLAYQLGGKFFSTDYVYMFQSQTDIAYGSNQGITKKLLNNTWTPENKSAKYPMQWYASYNDFYNGATFGSWKYTDMSLFNASYLRVKNLTLGYTLPKNLCTKAGLSGLRFYVSGDNLFLVSASKGIDPSMSILGGMEIGGWSYPNMTTVSFGVDVNF